MNQRVVIILLTLMVFGQVCNGSLLGNIRNMGPSDAPIHVSPAPSPVPNVNSDPKVSGGGGGDKSDKEGGDNQPKKDTIGSSTNERCKTSDLVCHIQDLTACLQSSGGVPEELSLLVQNGGDSTLNVNGTISSINFSFKDMPIPKYEAKKVSISAPIGNIQLIVLSSGNGDCVIYMGAPTSEGNFFEQFSDYTNQVTPMHGVYLLSFTVLITAVFWACCKFRKHGREGDGVPYQELELAQTDSLSAVNVETAEGWDQDWGDDWDEEGGIKSLGGNHVGNVSSNGLTSRSSLKDGWEDNWND